MPFSPIQTNPLRPAVVALIAATMLSLAACGGGGEDPPNGANGNPVPVPSIDTLAGNWVQRGCVRTGAQSFKRLLRANVIGPSKIDYFEGVLSYNTGDCTGTAQQVGPSRLGTVTFARSQANQTLTAHWGEFLTVTSTRFGAIWAVRPSQQLCLLGDEIPTSQPTLGAVATSLTTVPADNCFNRQNP
jgi:hypothetical protein